MMPHLITPVIIDLVDAATALAWVVNEMEARYKRLALWGVRSVDQYNALVGSNAFSMLEKEYVSELKTALPHLVIVVSELADLWVGSTACRKSLTRLVDRAHTVGIHIAVPV